MKISGKAIREGQKVLGNTLQIFVFSAALTVVGLIEMNNAHFFVNILGMLNTLAGIVLLSIMLLNRLFNNPNAFITLPRINIGFYILVIQPPAIFLISRNLEVMPAVIISLMALLVLIMVIMAEVFSSQVTAQNVVKRWVTDNYLLFAVGGGVIILDQITKIWVRRNIGPYQEIVPVEFLRGIFGLVNIQNSGAAFGMFQDGTLFFGLLALVISCVIIYYFTTIPKEDWMIRLALGMQLGGALGNFIDRMLYYEVTDFLYVHNFPVFNVADSAVSVGCVIIIVGVWLAEKRDEESRTSEQQSEFALDENSI